MRHPELADVVWRKSSRSGTNADCVEVGMVWRKSNRSGSNANCVEVAKLPRLVAVRDSKDPDGPVLTVDPAAWSAFVGKIRAGG